MSYDILLVGAGLTSASIAAKLKDKFKICIIDTRSHIGGNCYDYKSNKGYMHAYGPHFFHSPDLEVVNFLSHYTEWYEKKHTVSAQLYNDMKVPFPFSKETQKYFYFPMDEDKIINTFFKQYSKKMWGKEWEELPTSITSRVPKILETSEYFPNQFCGTPQYGYTHMFENMFDGVDIVLNADQDRWQDIDAKIKVYTGRPDQIKLKNGLRAGNCAGWVKYRSINFDIKIEKWDADTDVVNFVSLKQPYTRKTSYGHYFNNNSQLVVYETPRDSYVAELTPYYPVSTEMETVNACKSLVEKEIPGIIWAGRLGQNAYIDMYQAVNMGMNISEKILKNNT